MANKLLTVVKGLRPAIYLQVVALIMVIIAYGNYFHTMSAFMFPVDRWVMVMSVSAIILLSFSIINSLLMAEQFGSIFVTCAMVVMLILSVCLYLTPCLSPIGIYFTVGNMGNVEANAVGVPSVIRGVIFYMIGIIALIVSAFFPAVKEGCGILNVFFGKGGQDE